MASFSDPPVVTAPGAAALRWREYRRAAAQRLPGRRYVAAAAVALPLIALAFVRFGLGARFIVTAFVILTLCVLSAIDVAERRLPNVIVLPAAAFVLVAQTVFFPERAVEWFVAGIAAAIVLLLPLLVYPGSVGMGDVKLMLLLGAALGSAVVTALFVGSLAAAAYAGVLLARRGRGALGAAFPLGPFLALGAIVALLLGGGGA